MIRYLLRFMGHSLHNENKCCSILPYQFFSGALDSISFVLLLFAVNREIKALDSVCKVSVRNIFDQITNFKNASE